jgi:hypothetical protein
MRFDKARNLPAFAAPVLGRLIVLMRFEMANRSRVYTYCDGKGDSNQSCNKDELQQQYVAIVCSRETVNRRYAHDGYCSVKTCGTRQQLYSAIPELGSGGKAVGQAQPYPSGRTVGRAGIRTKRGISDSSYPEDHCQQMKCVQYCCNHNPAVLI